MTPLLNIATHTSHSSDQTEDDAVTKSVLEAIKMGIWDFEPREPGEIQYDATRALPGTVEKLDVLAERVERGLPLWHPADRRTYDDKSVD